MFKTALKWGFVLIGGYLLLSRATEAGRLVESGGSTANTLARTLQGR